MLVDLFNVLRYYGQVLGAVPGWITLVYFGLPLTAMIVCLMYDRRDLRAPFESLSHNTCHTVVWLAVILVIPVFGAILYFAFSVGLYHSWKNKNPEKHAFPYTYKLKRRQLVAVLIAGGIGLILQIFSSVHYAPEAAFMCWLVVIMLDWMQTIWGKAIFLQLDTKNGNVRQCDDLFDALYEQEADVLVTDRQQFSEDAKTVRAIADRVFEKLPYSAELAGKTEYLEGNGTAGMTGFTILATAQQWRTSGQDVIDARYAGHGVTRYIVGRWSESDGRQRCTECVVYRAVPRFREWLIRAGILQLVVLTLFSSWSTVIHLLVAHLLELFT